MSNHIILPLLHSIISLHRKPFVLFLIYFLAPRLSSYFSPSSLHPSSSLSRSSICSSISPDRLSASQRDSVTIRIICLPYQPAISHSPSLPLLYHPSFFNLTAPSLQPTIHHFPPDGSRASMVTFTSLHSCPPPCFAQTHSTNPRSPLRTAHSSSHSI